jgi:hypothetical protein
VLSIGYLAILLILPSLVWWRWGLLVALAVAAFEVLGVGLSFYVMLTYHLLPDLGPPERQPFADNPMAYTRRRQAEGYAQLFLFAFFPGLAALAGGALAAMWSAQYHLARRDGIERAAAPNTLSSPEALAARAICGLVEC